MQFDKTGVRMVFYLAFELFTGYYRKQTIQNTM
jgi:hypothetical protein